MDFWDSGGNWQLDWLDPIQGIRDWDACVNSHWNLRMLEVWVRTRVEGPEGQCVHMCHSLTVVTSASITVCFLGFLFPRSNTLVPTLKGQTTEDHFYKNQRGKSPCM